MTLPNRSNGPNFDAEGDHPGSPSDSRVDGDPSPRSESEQGMPTDSDPTDSMTPRRAKRADDDDPRPLTLPEPDVVPERLGDKRLLEMAIQATPDPQNPARHIPATRFAADFALCNDRTIRRYQAGERDLPPLLRRLCIDIVTEAAKKAARRAKR